MTHADHLVPPVNPSLASTAAPAKLTQPRLPLLKRGGLLAAIAALVVVVTLPQPDGLSIAGQNMLGIFAFAVIVWMTEAIDYAASSIILMALIAFLLGIAPDPAHPESVFGTGRALSAAMDGFTNPAVALISASLVIAAAMSITGLDRRLALAVVSLIGTSRSRLGCGSAGGFESA